MKKTFILFSIMFVFILSACGSKNSNQDAPMCPTQDNSKYLNTDLTNKPTIKFLGQSAGTFDPKNDPTAAVVERLTGYKVEYNQLPAANAEAALNTQLGGGTKYHAVKVTKNQYEHLVRNCALLDLSGYIDKYGPNIKNAISDESWSVVKYNGGIYGIPERSSSDNINWTIVLRKDWLDELDLDLPQTPAELKAVLVAFEAEYGKNNKEFVPLTLDKPNVLIPTISSGFGVYNTWQDVNGALVNQVELPGMKDYVNFMVDLANNGLIDKTIATNDFSKALTKFTQGNAGAIVAAWWNVPTIVDTLKAANQVGAELTYVQPLKDASGKSGITRATGVNYVTVVPKYMADQAAFSIDWIDKKLTEDNFREIVIGTENEHYFVDRQGNYLPNNTKFAEKDHSDYFLTGSYEPKYPVYWLARVRKNQNLYNAWLALNENADKVGKIDPLSFAPALDKNSQYKQSLSIKFMDELVNMIVNDKSSSKYDAFLTEWRNAGGKASTDEVNEWYKNK